MSLDLSQTATDILLELASDNYVQLVRETSTYDPITRTETVSTTTKTFLNCAVTSIDKSLIDNTRILSTDNMLICDNAIEPLETDFIEIEGKSKAVVQIIPINHAGIPQAYKVVYRG